MLVQKQSPSVNHLAIPHVFQDSPVIPQSVLHIYSLMPHNPLFSYNPQDIPLTVPEAS